VFGVDIDEAGLKATGDSIATAGKNGTFSAHIADVRDRAACHAAIQACVDQHGRLDILGNIAGIARAHHVTDVTEAEWELILGVNVSGPFWMAQAAIPHLLESGGNIVNIASNAGLMGQAYTVPYCVSKGAIVQLTRSLAMEFIKTPLRVNAIAPGGVNTALAANFTIPDNIETDLLMRYFPLRGSAEPEDVAALFAFVASDEGRNIHGAILSTDGGMTAG
jgi:NAD(P)-dependent dehydrogenase (short-subunit alcohol dehydrogenase family)